MYWSLLNEIALSHTPLAYILKNHLLKNNYLIFYFTTCTFNLLLFALKWLYMKMSFIFSSTIPLTWCMAYHRSRGWPSWRPRSWRPLRPSRQSRPRPWLRLQSKRARWKVKPHQIGHFTIICFAVWRLDFLNSFG